METCNPQRGYVQLDASGCPCTSSGCNKLDVYDWLQNTPPGINPTEFVEVRFKNTRKGFFTNVNGLHLDKGDIVAVEANPGHDIGIVSLTGPLVIEQIKKCNISLDTEFKKVYRKAKPADIEKWIKSTELDSEIMLVTRRIADDLKLNMKIGDVEYQGDGTKAIFYYIADERVDFRELIKILAEKFKIRIEMRQIGARQEAGRIGGIGTCGRELCCSTWVSNFVSVTTNAARYQELSLNPQKLAGQCGKLKCCLNYEVDAYIDQQKDFPSTSVALETVEGRANHQKTDVHKRIYWYSFEGHDIMNLIPVPVELVKEIQEMNKRGQKGPKISLSEDQKITPPPEFANAVGQDSITRFDTGRRRDQRRGKGMQNSQPRNQAPQNQEQNSPESSEARQQNQRPRNPNRDENRRPRPQNYEGEPRQARPQSPEQSEPRQTNPENGEPRQLQRSQNQGQNRGQQGPRPFNRNQQNRRPQNPRPQGPEQRNREPQNREPENSGQE
jgi:cell fate regulator YaaT (PSP1 superfamily)